jgi:hypothetical protein
VWNYVTPHSCCRGLRRDNHICIKRLRQHLSEKMEFYVKTNFKKCGKVNYIDRHVHKKRPLCSLFAPCMRVFVPYQILETLNHFSGNLVKALCDCYNLKSTFLNFFPLVIKIRQMFELMRRKGH